MIDDQSPIGMTALHALIGKGQFIIRKHRWQGWHVIDTEKAVLPIMGNHLCPLKAWEHVKKLEGAKHG